MNVNAETLRLAAAARAAVDRRVDGVTARLASSWASGWDSVVGEWESLFSDIERRVAAGETVSVWRLQRLERASQALTATAKIMDDLGVEVAQQSSQQIQDLVNDVQNYEAQMVGSQMPTDAGRQATLGANLLRVDPLQIQAIVLRTAEQITALTWPLADDAVAAMQSELIRGVAVGDNPRRAAARMLQRVEGRFNGGLARATNIARTEMLDAHREAARQFRAANTDVLQGWKWLATFDRRTCPSCLAKHGTEYPPDTPGPLDHQQGRCTSVPVTKSWGQLGFKNVTEPPDTFPSATDWYDSLSDADKLAVMGATRKDLLDSGQISWGDLSSRRSSAGWRDSYAPTSLTDLKSGNLPSLADDVVDDGLDAFPYTMSPEPAEDVIGRWRMSDDDRQAAVTATRAKLSEAMGNPVTINVSEDALSGVLSSKKFKNALDPDLNKHYAKNIKSLQKDIWGVPDTIGHEQRAVYGWSSRDMDRITGRPTTADFGDLEVRLKDNVRGRTTWTAGDSLIEEGRPLTRAELDNDDAVLASLGRYNSDKAVALGRGRDANLRYIEAQVHGGVSLADIDYVFVPRGSVLSEDLQQRLSKAGIRVVFG